MVDLPLAPQRIVTSEAPRSSISASDIMRQGDEAARTLGGVADALTDIATLQAKDQAAEELNQQKVTRNADGSVEVANPAGGGLIFGSAGMAYNDAVKVGTIAQHSNLISTELNDIHQRHQADPAGFRAAADGWRDKYMEDHGNGVLGQALRREFDQLTTQHFNAITNRAASADLATSSSSITALQTNARNDALAMARAGVTPSDPAMAEKIEQFAAAGRRRQANPLFGYSAEQGELDQKNFVSEVQAGNFLHGIDQVYKDKSGNGGYAAAMKKAEDILTNPGYSLSQPTREAYYHKAIGEIRAEEAARRRDITEAREAFNSLALASASNVQIDPNAVDAVAKQFKDAGDPGGAARVYASFIRKPLNDEFGRQPLAEQNRQLGALKGLNKAAMAFQFFIGKGYSQEQAAGIVGNLIHESGLDPAAVGDNGTSIGLAQFHKERATALKKFAEARGKPETDFQTQLEFIEEELNTTEGATRTKLIAAKTADEAAHAFIDYERPQGWTLANPAGGLGYESRRTYARSVLSGQMPDGNHSMGPAGSSWLAANRARTVIDTAAKTWTTVMADYKANGTRPSLQLANEVITAARLAGDADLLETVAQDVKRLDIARTASVAPLAAQQDAIMRLDAAGATGELTPGTAAVQGDLQRRYKAISEGLETNPIATTVQNFPERFKPPGPLDLSSEGALAGSLAERAAISQFAAENWGTAPLSVLDQQDVAQLQAVMQSPAGGTALRIMATALKPNEMLKLLDNKGFRDSVVGMQTNPDAAKMSAAMSVVDKLWRSNPALAEQTFSASSIDKLHAWQGMKDTFTAEEIARNLNAPRDPAAARVREEARKAALSETSSMKADDVAYKLGAGSWLFGGGAPLSASSQYASSGKPVDYRFLPDSMAGGVLMDEYRQTYAALRADGVDASKASELAVERMKSKWTVSQAAGGRLMKYAPESSPSLPSINGSKDWIDEDLRAWVTKHAGSEFKESRRSAEVIGFSGQERRWKIAGLIADSQTEAEFSAGQRPSYIVAIQRDNGTLALLGFDRGSPRVTFDPTDEISAYERKLRERQRTIEQARSSEFSLANALP